MRYEINATVKYLRDGSSFRTNPSRFAYHVCMRADVHAYIYVCVYIRIDSFEIYSGYDVTPWLGPSVIEIQIRGAENLRTLRDQDIPERIPLPFRVDVCDPRGTPESHRELLKVHQCCMSTTDCGVPLHYSVTQKADIVAFETDDVKISENYLGSLLLIYIENIYIYIYISYRFIEYIQWTLRNVSYAMNFLHDLIKSFPLFHSAFITNHPPLMFALLIADS